MKYDLLLPLGLRAGAAATAIRDLKPSSIVFLATTQSEKNIDKVFEVAGYSAPYEIVYAYTSEEYLKVIDRLLEMGEPDKIVLTGGTTMMQSAIVRIAEIFGSRQFIVLDHRPPTREIKESWDISNSGVAELQDKLIHCDYITYDISSSKEKLAKQIVNVLEKEGLQYLDGVIIKLLKGGVKIKW